MLSNQALADYCIALHRKNSEQLGLLPADRMREYVDRGQVFVAWEGGEACGYLIAGMTPPWARVWQACVEFTVRGLGHGAVMVAKLEAEAKRRGCTGITLRCRDGLDSNLFWQALGFHQVRQIPGGGRRGKPLNVWAMQINDDLLGVAMTTKLNRNAGVPVGGARPSGATEQNASLDEYGRFCEAMRRLSNGEPDWSSPAAQWAWAAWREALAAHGVRASGDQTLRDHTPMLGGKAD